MNHELRFGVFSPFPTVPIEKMIQTWKQIEALGFDSLWNGDHFVNATNPTDPWYEAWTLLAAMATYTSEIRIGLGVTAILFHNPAFLARQALTVDHLSKGRLELGLGTGEPVDPSYEMTGIPNLSTGERVARFGEYVEIVDQLLCNEVTTYEGRYYKIQGAVMNPHPIQTPRPPIIIAAKGRAMLKHAARYADTWNTFVGFTGTFEERIEEARRQNELLTKYCVELGREPQTLRRSILLYEPEARTRRGLLKIYDSVDNFREAIERYKAIGMTEFLLYYPFMEEQVPIFERIARKVIPELKKQNLMKDSFHQD